MIRLSLAAALVLTGSISEARDPDVDAIIERSDLIEIMAEAPRYEHGEGIPKNAAAAIRLYCFAAIRHQNPHAKRALGWMYANGRGVDRDDDLAAAWFREAEAGGCVISKHLAPLIEGPDPVTAICVYPEKPTAVTGDEMPIITRHDDRQLLTARVINSDHPTRPDIDAIVAAYATQQDLDPALVHAVIKTESAYNPLATSIKGAQGLMQLMPATAKRFKVTRPYNARENVAGGTRYLRWLLNYFNGDTRLAVAGYYAGEGRAHRTTGKVGRQIAAYVQTVFGYLE